MAVAMADQVLVLTMHLGAEAQVDIPVTAVIL
jgi:hypothetical protein